MPFGYQIVVSPWVQEQLYDRMVTAGEKSLRTFLPKLWLEAVQDPKVRRRAIEIATKQAAFREG